MYVIYDFSLSLSICYSSVLTGKSCPNFIIIVVVVVIIIVIIMAMTMTTTMMMMIIITATLSTKNPFSLSLSRFNE